MTKNTSGTLMVIDLRVTCHQSGTWGGEREEEMKEEYFI